MVERRLLVLLLALIAVWSSLQSPPGGATVPDTSPPWPAPLPDKTSLQRAERLAEKQLEQKLWKHLEPAFGNRAFALQTRVRLRLLPPRFRPCCFDHHPHTAKCNYELRSPEVLQIRVHVVYRRPLTPATRKRIERYIARVAPFRDERLDSLSVAQAYGG